MTEALKPIIAYGFGEMNLHRIEALTATYNVPSQKLLENNDFVKEGLLREHYMVDGKAENSVIFSLLKSEYRP